MLACVDHAVRPTARLARAVCFCLVLAGCTKASVPPATEPTGVGNVSTAGGAPGANSDSTPPTVKADEPRESVVERTQRRAKLAAKQLVLAEERAKVDGAWASPLFPLALARANGAVVDQTRIDKLYARVKERVCFGQPKLNLVDRTKRKKPSDAIAMIKEGAEAKLAEARAKCAGGDQPLTLLVRMDVIEELESPDKVRATRLKPGVVLPEGQAPGPNDVYEYEIDTLKRTVFANGEVSIESRVFPFKVQEMSKDKGNARATAGGDAVRLKDDPLEVRSSNQLNAAITERILAVVQQALDRHVEGLVKAYTTMALSTATIDAGASQEHHLIEVLAVGGQIDANPTVAQQLSERYELPIADIKAAIAGLGLK